MLTKIVAVCSLCLIVKNTMANQSDNSTIFYIRHDGTAESFSKGLNDAVEEWKQKFRTDNQHYFPESISMQNPTVISFAVIHREDSSE